MTSLIGLFLHLDSLNHWILLLLVPSWEHDGRVTSRTKSHLNQMYVVCKYTVVLIYPIFGHLGRWWRHLPSPWPLLWGHENVFKLMDGWKTNEGSSKIEDASEFEDVLPVYSYVKAVIAIQKLKLGYHRKWSQREKKPLFKYNAKSIYGKTLVIVMSAKWPSPHNRLLTPQGGRKSS